MKSHTLNFQMLYDFKCFEIEFESESPERNILMEVKYDGFPLDVPQLMFSHPVFNLQIKAAMENNADTFWSERRMVIPIHRVQPVQ